MTTNPNLLFALQSISEASPPSPTLSPSSPTCNTSKTSLRLRSPRHGCVNGAKITTCKNCMGRVLRDMKLCVGCKGTGFAMNKCGACHAGAITLAVLIKENAAALLAEDVTKAGKLAEETAEQTTMEEAGDEG